jgi:hypothetical protein
MSFLAPLLFALAGFAAVPVLLHLIRRKRVRILDFPTFKFLQKAALQQRIHLRLQDQLLMLLRILVILLLVLAFAGPLTSRSVDSEGPVLGTKNLLIVDDSLSMSALAEGDVTLFSKALQYGQSLTGRSNADWSVALASQIDSTTGYTGLATGRPEDFFEAAPTLTDLSTYLSVYEVAQRADALLDSNTAIWTLTDAAASNFQGVSTDTDNRETPLQFLVLDPPSNQSNWTLRELTLNNQPLLENEPALLTAVYERFGPFTEGSRPTEIAFDWRSEDSLDPETASFTLNASSGTVGRFRTALQVDGRIASASCRLLFREGEGDALRGDDSLEIFPSALGESSIVLLTDSENWRRLLQAALVDYRVLAMDPTQPPPQRLEPASAFIALLTEKDFQEDWVNLLESRLEAGAGVLVLYDNPAVGVRLETWSRWWARWGERIEIEELKSGPKEARGGANPWFAQSLQEILLTELDWAEGGFPLARLSEGEGEGEWFLGEGTEGYLPIFQTDHKGEGLIASFAVPLSLKVSPLVLEPHWVPLLSQMVKRTLFDPGSVEAPNRSGLSAAESDLAPLSEEGKLRLSASGCRFIEVDRFMADIEKLPTRSHDWTVVCLLACLGLAIVEIALSNLL